jgi:glycine cleavage system pyridoxal-binding protein P
MPIPEEPHIKITMQMMYREQQETNKLLAKTVTHLENLQDLPERVRNLEIQIAKQKVDIESVKKTSDKANGAIVGAIIGIGTAIYSFFR